MARTGLPRVYRKTDDRGRPVDPPKRAELEDGRWWLAEAGSRECAEQIRTVLERNYQAQTTLRADMTTSWRLYDNTPIAGLTPKLYRPKVPTARMRRIPWNLVKSVCDTYVAMITDETPKVSFSTSGGNRTLQRKAKLCEKFVAGVLYDNMFDGRTNQACVLDSAIFPFGGVKVYADWTNPKKPRIQIDRVRAWEDYTNEHDAVYGDPQSKMLASWVDKYALADEFQDKADEIIKTVSDQLQGGGGGMAEAYGHDGMSTMALLIESWHLPRVPGKDGSKDGRHVLSVGGVVLVDEPWYRKSYGLKYLYRRRPVAGIWGQSFPIELAPLQVAIAKTLHNVDLTISRGVPHLLIPEGSEINTNAIDDRPGSMIRFTGAPPEWAQWAPLGPDVVNYLNLQWQRGFEMLGISQNLAASEAPSQFRSGEAQKVYAQIQQQRFEPCYREYQQWYVDVVKEILAVAKEIADEFPNYEVSAAGGKQMMSAVRYLDAHLEEDEFVLKLLPTNKLADDPAAQLDYVQNAMNAGMMTQEVGQRLIDSPDTAEYNAYEFARYDYVMTSVDKMLDDGDEVAPDPEAIGPDFLMQAIELVSKAYTKACIDDVDPKRRLLLLQFRDVMKGWVPPPPPPAPPMGPPGAPPPGAPPPPGMPPGAPPPMSAMVGHDLMKQEAGQAAAAIGG